MTKYTYPYVFMSGNEDDVDEEWRIKMILDNDNNNNKKQEGTTTRTTLMTTLPTTMRTSNMTQYIYPYVFMTGDKDDVDEEWTTKMIWTTMTTTTTKQKGTTTRTILMMILQTSMRASCMTKYIYPYVFMSGNEGNVDEEQTMKTIWTMTTTTTRNKKE